MGRFGEMTDDYARNDGIADVINLLAAPIAGGIRTVEQVRRGVDELLTSIENMNRTMANLNETAERINVLLGEVEEPIRTMMPQLTRTIRAADEITAALEEPVRSAAPNLERAVGALSSPAFMSLPGQINEFMATVTDVSQRLGPLTQLAENAGGLLGGLRVPGMSRPASRPAVDEPTPHITATTKQVPTPREQPGGTPPAKQQAAAKQPAPKKPAAKKRAKKPATKKPAATAKKAAAKSAAKDAARLAERGPDES